MSVQNSREVIDHLLVQRLDMGNGSKRECVMDGLRRADTARKMKFFGFTPLASPLRASPVPSGPTCFPPHEDLCGFSYKCVVKRLKVNGAKLRHSVCLMAHV